jgi:FkbM family methyltransferase
MNEEYNEMSIGEGTYERFGVHVQREDVVIDCGANVGLFSIFCNTKGIKKVYAFEPVQENLDILKRTVELNNPEKNIVIVNKGLSNVNDTVKISISGVAFEFIEVVKLDDFIEENNIQKVDFIKADIEGAERLMLEGAKRTLKKFKPKLAICTYHLKDDVEVLTKIIMDANPEYEIYYGHKKIYAK